MNPTPMRAKYSTQLDDNETRCVLCPHRCRRKPSGIGICSARKNRDGIFYALTYGEVTSAAYDPIEKKPLYHFMPGKPIFSIGGWGCNLKCVFCQNSPISQYESPTVPMTPQEVAKAGGQKGSVGVAYTYNEPIIAIEYVMDCAKEVRRAGGKNVLVTNGYIEPGPLADLLPLIDAMNIDLKGFNDDFYHRLCGGSLEPVLATVEAAVRQTHVELTTLIIPDTNDAVPELEDQATWIANHCGPDVPVHLTAYHPSYNYTKAATTAQHLSHAWKIFRSKLNYVYLGNVKVPGGGDTICVNCGKTVIGRSGFQADLSGMKANGDCANCGAHNNIVT